MDAEIPHIGQRVTLRCGLSVPRQFMRKRGGIIMSPRHLLGHFADPFQLFPQD